MTDINDRFYLAWVHHRATGVWIVLWVPKGEPHDEPPPGAAKRLFLDRKAY